MPPSMASPCTLRGDGIFEKHQFTRLTHFLPWAERHASVEDGNLILQEDDNG